MTDKLVGVRVRVRVRVRARGRAGARRDANPKLARPQGGEGADQRKAPPSFCTTANTAPAASNSSSTVRPSGGSCTWGGVGFGFGLGFGIGLGFGLGCAPRFAVRG